MAQTSDKSQAMVEWTVSVPKELDDDVRTFLIDFKFGETMSLSQLLDQALSHYMMLLVTEKMSAIPHDVDLSESE